MAFALGLFTAIFLLASLVWLVFILPYGEGIKGSVIWYIVGLLTGVAVLAGILVAWSRAWPKD